MGIASCISDYSDFRREVILGIGFPLVLVELGIPPLRGGRGREASWLRLARAARAHRAALLVTSPYQERAAG